MSIYVYYRPDVQEQIEEPGTKDTEGQDGALSASRSVASPVKAQTPNPLKVQIYKIVKTSNQAIPDLSYSVTTFLCHCRIHTKHLNDMISKFFIYLKKSYTFCMLLWILTNICLYFKLTCHKVTG
jgi:hypothetical protein